MYITYEEPLKGKCFTEKQMQEVYKDLADKAEYPDFECWFTDMLKSGVFEKKDGDKLCTEKQNSFVSLKAF